MKRFLLIGFLMYSGGLFAQDYLFYLHNRFIEEFELAEEHPQYGRGEYLEIIDAFSQNGFTVISEKRPKNTDIRAYAKKVVKQIDSLLQKGVAADHITVLGTSKGGYIAQYVSTYLNNPDVNFVFIGCYMADDVKEWPDIRICGNILSIYDVSDTYGVPMLERVETSTQKVTRFRELELTTGMKHGFLYKPLQDWVFPATQWGKRNYKWNDFYGAVGELSKESDFPALVLVARNYQVLYEFDLNPGSAPNEVPLVNNRYWIGSISKQFTAVIVLQEVEKGHIDLHAPISRYLPEITESWADSVTVHHLLTHTHGIPEPDIRNAHPQLSFPPGTAYDYSQYGYGLLARIAEKTSGKSFAELSEELFRRCDMLHTFHPDRLGNNTVLAGNDGTRKILDVPAVEPAAGGFASTASDLLTWNNRLHDLELLSAPMYRLMMTAQPNAVREHPLFGKTLYGYGITITVKNGVLQLGQTGKVPGFCSMDFYYPETGISLIVLSNRSVDRGENTLQRSFAMHMRLLEILENSGMTRKLRYAMTVDR